jgi:hypothetical protein
MTDLEEKVKQGWGYDIGPAGALFSLDENDELVVIAWPTDNPPSLAEIEAIELPEPSPVPDWASFQVALISSPSFLRIVGHNNVTLAIAPVLTNLAFMVSSQPEVVPRFIAAWNAIAAIAEPTESEIAALNTIGTDTHVPFALNAQGMMG